MPIYDYRCNRCGKRSSFFLRTFEVSSLACPFCGAADLLRLVTSFAFVRSEESRLEEMADPSKLGDLDEEDPRSIARWAKRMGREMGEDLGPEFDEMVDKMESGEMPEDTQGEPDLEDLE